MPLPAIDALSESSSNSSERRLAHQDTFGRRPVRKRIRKDKGVLQALRKGEGLRKALCSLLSKCCGGKCKLRCLAQFKQDEAFNELVKFREHWYELHKLDQDRLVFQLDSSTCLGC